MFSDRIKKGIPFLSKFQLFDYFIFGTFLLLAVAFFIFFFRKQDYLTVRIKITEKNVLYAQINPPPWFTYLFKKGMTKKDNFGRIDAEILDVYYYDTAPDTAPANKAVYLTIKLKATHTRRTQEYTYYGTPVVVGEGLKINFGKILAEGLIVEVEGLKNFYEESYLQIKARVYEYQPSFSETTGVEPHVAEAIKVGDKIFDSSGKLMAEVLDKEVLPAQKTTFDDKSNSYLRTDPRRKDMFLTLKIRTKKINNEYYFFDDVRIKVNEAIPLHFSKISIYPLITDILSD